ncbi:hypothetical protein Efla_000192 [Eimeria flavescens]
MAIQSDKGMPCSDPLCKQRDFLPFHCNKCDMVFCLEHYLPDCHSCPKKQVGDRRVYVCPSCLDVVRLVELETDEDAALRHRPQCKPELREQREQAKKGRTCPVKGCRERLTAITSYECPNCHVDVCLKHRLKEDHDCNLLKAHRKEKRHNSFIRQLSANATRAVKIRRPSDSSNPENSKDHKVGPWEMHNFVSEQGRHPTVRMSHDARLVEPLRSLAFFFRNTADFARLCNHALESLQGESCLWEAGS